MNMFRTRFKKEIVTEFLPPSRRGKKQKVIILCDGMPSIPRKQPLAQFLAGKGYWVFYPRYRGAWESDGVFLAKSPHQDILDVIDELPKGVREVTFGERFSLSPDEIFVIGGSFGGAAALLCSIDSRVKKAIANCPVVDWAILRRSEKAETSNPSYAAYIREAFGKGYRLSEKNWKKLHKRNVLQSSAPRCGNNAIESDDVPRPGRPLHSLSNCEALCGSHRSETQLTPSWRPREHRLYRSHILARDQEVLRVTLSGAESSWRGDFRGPKTKAASKAGG